MRFSIPVLRTAAALSILLVTVACGPADAAARTGNVAAASATPAGTGSATDSLAARDSAAPAGSRVNAVSGAPGESAPMVDSALLARADRGRVLGAEDAMWIVMISDFQCPYCKQWHDSSMTALKRDYIDKGIVRLAYLHLPLPNHTHATGEAEASMCAAAQGKFWEYADALFAVQQQVARVPDIGPTLLRIADELKLDRATFVTCRQSESIRMLVQNDVRQAAQARVQSTPSFLVGDFLVQGALPYSDFRRAIDTALVVARARKKP